MTSEPERAEGPAFVPPERRERWSAARRAAAAHVLTAIAESPWADDLVLRGSVLLRAWYGTLAREPGDLDFIVVPEERRPDDDGTEPMLDGILRAAEKASLNSPGPAVRLSAGSAVRTDIWAYDQVPGWRLAMPWEAEGLPGGTVQVDLAFGEHLPVAPEVALVPRPDGAGPVPLQAATPGLALAWKVFWLLTDDEERPKDLYDAWLLAQHTALDLEVLDALHTATERGPSVLRIADLKRVTVDEDEFRAEVPGVRGTAADYVRMLTGTLRLI